MKINSDESDRSKVYLHTMTNTS